MNKTWMNQWQRRKTCAVSIWWTKHEWINGNVAKTCAVTKLLGFRIEEVFTTQQSCSFYFQCTHTGSTKQQFPMVLQFESIIWTSYMERRCFFKTFLCSKLLFLDVQRWVFFQETQTGQPSDNFPWFFDLNPSFERTASRVDAFTFSQLTLELFVVCFSGWIFFQKLKQANQATISHGSSTCLHPFDVLHRENMFLFYFIRQKVSTFCWMFLSF